MHGDKRIVPEAIKAGALGFVPKDADGSELMTAIRSVAEGRAYLSPRLSSALVDGLASTDAASPSRPQLTGREKEIVQLLAEGKAMKEIAATLHVSVKTVEAHRRRVMKKMGLGGTAALTKFAVREGLTCLE
jgi:DNA-binding NarL/FixJ family response regulator